jgi:hypothetical protein
MSHSAEVQEDESAGVWKLIRPSDGFMGLGLGLGFGGDDDEE